MNRYIVLGLLINAGCNVVNRFVYEIPDAIAIFLYLAGIGCCLAGLILAKRKAAS